MFGADLEGNGYHMLNLCSIFSKSSEAEYTFVVVLSCSVMGKSCISKYRRIFTHTQMILSLKIFLDFS